MNPNRLRLNDVLVFDGHDYQKGKRWSVSIERDRIVAVEEAHPAEEGEQVLELGGKFLMPGLIDAHFHANSPSLNVGVADRLAESHLAQHARKYLEEELLRGFTTVRDAGGADPGLAQAVREGLIVGPDLYVSGKALSQTGGHGDMREGVQLCGCAGYTGSLSCVVDGADEVRRHVRELLRSGVDQIKIFVSGGVLSPTDPIWMEQFIDAEILAAVEEAERRRTYVMAHAHTSSAIQRCVRLGVRSIEHGLLMDEKTADIVAGSESYIVATLLIVSSLISGRLPLPPGALEKAKSVADAAVKAIEFGDRAGVRFGFGTDLLGELHGMELEELVLRSSISGTLATLRSATTVNAEIMGLKGEIGCIMPGARADILILDANPIDDIGALVHNPGAYALLMKNGVAVVDRLTAQ
ncbi:amidohydrolase family protein [Sphingobium sp. SCG-1]|nr:amidohydrolase family protein [Sphingobium sp. SCG-1]